MPALHFIKAPAAISLILMGMAGCSARDLADHSTLAARQAPYPALVPLDELLNASTEARTNEGSADHLSARARQLKARAKQLRAQNGG
jgi:hypothetical protein